MKSIVSYPSIYTLGHAAISDIFNGDVVVEEKVDGSQFSFMVSDGVLYCRSKGTQVIVDAPNKMFVQAVQTAVELQPLLVDGWVYRCEYLQKPKHNTLAYERVPAKHLILFDVMTGVEEYLSPERKSAEAKRLGLEVVPVLFQGHVTGIDMLRDLLKTKSVLGGCYIEGVVIKNYSLFTRAKKITLAKYVSEGFKEKHGGEWRKANPSSGDIVKSLITTYRHETRWQKAIQHMRDDGRLECSPRDIGALLREVQKDVKKECGDEIKDALFAHFWPKIRRGLTSGLPEWYKELLAKEAFSHREETV